MRKVMRATFFIIVLAAPPPVVPLSTVGGSVQPAQRRIQWETFRRQFGARWEGQTAWFRPRDEGWIGQQEQQEVALTAISEPLTSIYQLEFPRLEPEVGTWRGWGVLAAGDTRVVSLSEETALERSPGSTTFQFEGVGGRCSLQSDGPNSWAAEVNFFHENRRAGVVVYCTTCTKGGGSAEDGGGAAAAAAGEEELKAEEWSFMSMTFRAARLSDDGNLTFATDGNVTLSPPHQMFVEPSDEQQRLTTATTMRCTRRETMDPLSFAIRSVETGEEPSLPQALGISAGGEVAKGNALPLLARLPDGVSCSFPRTLRLRRSPEQPRITGPGQAFRFACDFRDIGGPVRFVSIEYNKGRLVRWLCEDWTDDT
jgi:hypothetical protein